MPIGLGLALEPDVMSGPKPSHDGILLIFADGVTLRPAILMLVVNPGPLTSGNFPLVHAGNDRVAEGQDIMIAQIGKLLRALRSNVSGNATMLVALGLPALIGGTGFAVDTAQWYMWKRELQFAADQAAIAGAWARTKDATKDSYEARAAQQFNANLSQTTEFVSTPAVALASYAGGANNSVIVSASATKELPFSGFITGNATTVAVFAQASYAEGVTFTSCIVAVDEDADGAITIGGSSVLTAGCGMAALSESDQAVLVNGNPQIDAGWILAKGGIDPWFEENTDDIVMAYMNGLFDPFANLSPPATPASQVARTYSCPKGKTTTTADYTEKEDFSYSYKKGKNKNGASTYGYGSPKPSGSTVSGPTNITVANGTTAGTTTEYPDPVWTPIGTSGKETIWEIKTSVITKTYQNVVIEEAGSTATVASGTYADLKLKCDTIFTGGVYIIDGGTLDITSQYDVTGSGVMFILKNGAGISINGGANVNLTAMTVSELTAQGVSAAEAAKLQGMLIFEDRDSQGNANNKLNGNASTVLNGTVYLPVSNLTFSGTATVSSQCLMLAANTITLTGNANMTTFCPAGSIEDTTVVSMASDVKLVS